MLTRPYRCSSCLNWFTPQIKEPEDACIYCVEDRHAHHPVTGATDCHFMEWSATPSERGLQEIAAFLAASVESIQMMPDKIQKADTQDQITDMLEEAERSFAYSERIQDDVRKHIEWAGVKEMPGLRGEPFSHRYKNVEALSELVIQNRRPQSDLDRVDHAIKLCGEISAEVADLTAQVRSSVGLVRQAVTNWQPKEADEKPPLYVSDKDRDEKPRRRRKQTVNA